VTAAELDVSGRFGLKSGIDVAGPVGPDSSLLAGKGMRLLLRQEILNQTFETIQLVRPIVESVARRDRDLSSQIRRAMSSVGLNLAEGFGTAAGNARLRFETARGSLYEAQAGIGLAVAWGFVAQNNAAPALEAMDKLGGRIFGLSRR
jgi:four helix bundle protein